MKNTPRARSGFRVSYAVARWASTRLRFLRAFQPEPSPQENASVRVQLGLDFDMRDEQQQPRVSLVSIVFRARPKQWLMALGVAACLIGGFAAVVLLIAL